MKKSIFLVFLLIGLTSLLSSCCNCGQSVSEENTLRGIITAVGNDPFMEIAVKTEDNTNVVLICSKELKKELIDAQGKYYLIQFSEKKVDFGVTSVVVEKAVPIIKK